MDSYLPPTRCNPPLMRKGSDDAMYTMDEISRLIFAFYDFGGNVEDTLCFRHNKNNE
jgi:hypothetical protein